MRILWLVIITCTIVACSRKLQLIRISQINQIEALPSSTPLHNCGDILNYVPDSNAYTQIIRVNVHFMDALSNDKNFSLEDGRKYMRYLIKNANMRIRENKKMNLPEGNNTPALHPKYQYKITGATSDPQDDGFYKHLDDDLYYFLNKGKYKNNYDQNVIKKYSVGKDSILNIFVLPHHPDSVASKTYHATVTGIALGTSLKVSGLYERKDKPWECASILNHEIGHILGLSHSWLKNDGCEDTPAHSNCWELKDEPPCDGIISNNMMDYNNSQGAISPCQLGIVHRGFSRLNSKTRKILEPQWCRLDTSKIIIIDDLTRWKGDRDIKHDILIKEGGVLEVYCRLSMPENGKITIQSGGKLILNNARLHNACGRQWNGIFMESIVKSKGEIIASGSSVIENVYAAYSIN